MPEQNDRVTMRGAHQRPQALAEARVPTAVVAPAGMPRSGVGAGPNQPSHHADARDGGERMIEPERAILPDVIQIDRTAVRRALPYVARAGALAMLVGGAGPWASVSSPLVEITSSPPAQALVFLCGLATFVVLVRYGRHSKRRAAVGCMAGFAGFCALECVVAYVYIMRLSQQALGVVHPDWGIYLAFLGSLVSFLALAGLTLMGQGLVEPTSRTVSAG